MTPTAPAFHVRWDLLNKITSTFYMKPDLHECGQKISLIVNLILALLSAADEVEAHTKVQEISFDENPCS